MNFNAFASAVKANFNEMARGQLFRVETHGNDLWDTYLQSFPKGSNPMFRERTEHDCNCCKNFILAVGNVVTITKDLKLKSIWDISLPGEPEYQQVADALKVQVENSRIDNLFFHWENKAGAIETFENRDGDTIRWGHFHVDIPRQFVEREPGYELGVARAKFDVGFRGLTELKASAIDDVLDLIDANSLYRGTEFRQTVKQFGGLKADWNNDRNFVWSVLDDWSLTIRNSAIGTLLVDLSDGVELEKAVKSYESKVAPANYKRPSALVTPKMVEAAKQAVEAAGLTSALKRRPASIEDVCVNNVFFANADVMQRIGEADPFAQVATLSAVTAGRKLSIEEFIQDVLPGSSNVEMFFENKHKNQMVSMLTADDPDAAPLFKWNNPFSWSYIGDMTDSIKERVKAAGGNVTGDVRVSLSWFNHDDLDLHIGEPKGYQLYFGTRRQVSPCGGTLDVDMNAGLGTTREPVENIIYEDKFWMKDGTYIIEVNNYYQRETKDVGFTIQVEILGQVVEVHYDKPVRQSSTVEVGKLIVKGGQVTFESNFPTSTRSQEVWGLKTQEWHDVKFICPSPNYWDEQQIGNLHYFFMLSGCNNDGSARGFYNEFLKSELDQHRKVMELVGSKMRIEFDDSQLSGVGFSSTQRNDVKVRVTKGGSTQVYEVTF